MSTRHPKFLRERRLGPVRRLIELVRDSGLSLSSLAAGAKALATLFNELGLDKSKLSSLFQVLQLLQRYLAIKGPWTDEEAMQERIDVALAIAGHGVQLTKTTTDDDLLAQIEQWARNETVRGLVIAVLVRLLGERLEATPEGDELLLGVVSGDDVQTVTAEAAARSLPPGTLLKLLPYLLELFDLLRTLYTHEMLSHLAVSSEEHEAVALRYLQLTAEQFALDADEVAPPVAEPIDAATEGAGTKEPSAPESGEQANHSPPAPASVVSKPKRGRPRKV